ncbi:hypothetical protein [Mycolicibacter algericus]|uniref:Uncharacterized protein n=1 Tax=Mycolicibacter algericus TaxID=1288388 RepID=A0A7I9Y430_MYCAL|nr:hypothetical protein [Mycolicibacter algericus]GFG83337.1 hypothetical protein MALGJ_00130 [Mycolicibacter algericus]
MRPAQDGSFLIEVVRVATENWDVVANAVTNAVTDNWENAQATASALGAPTIAAVVWWATKSLRADVKDFSYLDNGRVKINWQDDTVDEVPLAAWKELQKRGRRRKSQLRQIMAPLADSRVTKVDVSAPVDTQQPELPITKDAAPRVFALIVPITPPPGQRTRSRRHPRSSRLRPRCRLSTSIIPPDGG